MTEFVDILVAIGGWLSPSSPWFGFEVFLIIVWGGFWLFYVFGPFIRAKFRKWSTKGG